jgi:hypothetical protein
MACVVVVAVLGWRVAQESGSLCKLDFQIPGHLPARYFRINSEMLSLFKIL